MSEVLFCELPKVATSVFVLVPRTAEEKEFVVVIDKDKIVQTNGVEDRTRGKKLPGGGASNDRAIPSSAQAEIFEETGLNIDPPTRKIAEVHKADKDGHSHHWLAMLAMPPVSSIRLRQKREEFTFAHGEARVAIECEIEEIQREWPLEPGDEIAEARWETTGDILNDAAEHRFFNNHRTAFKWYLSGHSNSALADILLDRRIISYFVEDDGCLVLCYDPSCEVCERDEEEVSVVSVSSPKEEDDGDIFSRRIKSIQISRIAYGAPLREVRPPAISPEEQKLSGKVELMFVSADRFEERIWLMRDPAKGFKGNDVLCKVEHINVVTPHVVVLDKPLTVTELAARFGLKAERQASIAKSGVTAVLIVCGKISIIEGCISFVINDAPPSDLQICIDQAKTVLEVVERFNRIHASQLLWMHDEWRGLIGRIKFEEFLRRQAARERGQSFVASPA